MDIGIGREVLLRESEIAGINNHREIRTAAELVRGIDRIVEALIEVGAESSRKMRSGGEAKNAHSLGIDMPLGCVSADDADCALRILQCRGRLGVRSGIGHAIFDQNAIDARGVEPVTDLRAFEIDGENLIAASRKYDNANA